MFVHFQSIFPPLHRRRLAFDAHLQLSREGTGLSLLLLIYSPGDPLATSTSNQAWQGKDADTGPAPRPQRPGHK